jgi:hypothetical protein
MAMRGSISVAAVGVVISASLTVPTTGHAAPIEIHPTSAACTSGTWVQTPAKVTPAMENGSLDGVTIVSATDAWAVGDYYTGTTVGSLWEHWNGSRWNVVTSGGLNVALTSVVNFGADDVWAAGNYQTGGAVIAQWNGTTVVRAKIPSGGQNTQLFQITGSSPTDIWAIGTSSVHNGPSRTLLYHYNGTAWSLIKPPSGIEGPWGIVDVSPSDVDLLTLVGPFENDLYRYNGVKWSLAQSDVPVYGYLAGSSDSDLYGDDQATASKGIDHWNGSTWQAAGAIRGNATGLVIAEGPVGTAWTAGVNLPGGSVHVYVGENNRHQTSPHGIMNQVGSMMGIASGSDLVIAVGDQQGASTPSEPIVLMRCG